MTSQKTKSATKSASEKIEVNKKKIKEIQLQNRKKFFENALANTNNNPFKIVILQEQKQ